MRSAPVMVNEPWWVSGEITVATVNVDAKGNRGMAFKVASVSSNRNGFGLKGVILVDREGRAFQVGASEPNIPKVGDVVVIPFLDQKHCRGLNFSALYYEIPEELPTAPEGVVQEVWQE